MGAGPGASILEEVAPSDDRPVVVLPDTIRDFAGVCLIVFVGYISC
jgi:hypothetical protein